MRKRLCQSGIGIGLALLCSIVLAGQLEDAQDMFGKLPIAVLIVLAIIFAVYVISRTPRDDSAAPLSALFEGRRAIHCVGPEMLITECVSRMTAHKIGALIVMDRDKVSGIFTERDALNRVLSAGLDPATTRVSGVMTPDPYCIPPTTTVGEAMRLVTKRRFRHLPIVENGKVLAVVSSRDLTRWLVKDKIGEVQQLFELVART